MVYQFGFDRLVRHRQILDAKSGSLKRSLGMAFPASTIPKAFGFEAATQPWE
jgi:light-regulated signal transduction histidine kinase (bacteriophytochrome)